MSRSGFLLESNDILWPVWIFCAVSAATLATAWIVSWVMFGTIGGVDARLLLAPRGAAVGDSAEGDPVRQLMICATALGALPTLLLFVLFTAGLLAAAGRKRAGLLLVLRSGGGVGAANLLKRVVDRPRPSIVEHWTTFSSSSFPSGHSADATIVYLLLATLALGRTRVPMVRCYLVCAAIALATLVGFSRVYLGVHWPTDVLGGWFVGSAWVTGCLAIDARSSRAPTAP